LEQILLWKIICITQQEPITDFLNITFSIPVQYRGADKSLARPGRKQAAPVKIVIAAEWIDLTRVGKGDGLL